MSEQDFELYLTLLAKTLRLSDKQRRAIAGELRDHLEMRLEELTAEGIDKHTAIQTALAEFGDASALANDFTTIGKNRKRKHIMQTAFGTIAAAAVVGFAAVTLTPTNYWGQPTQPNAGAQQSDPEPSPGPATLDPGAGEADAFAGGGAATPRGLSGRGGMNPAGGRVAFGNAPAFELDIHVVDCTEILSPRDDGLDLLDRTEALASAVEETVAAIRPHGPSEIQVRAFEEFLIITATDEAYAQAQQLLEKIGRHVEQRDAIQRERDAVQNRRALDRIQVEIAQTADQIAMMQQRLIEAEQQMGEHTVGSPESQRLRAVRDELRIQIELLQSRREHHEQRRTELLSPTER